MSHTDLISVGTAISDESPPLTKTQFPLLRVGHHGLRLAGLLWEADWI